MSLPLPTTGTQRKRWALNDATNALELTVETVTGYGRVMTHTTRIRLDVLDLGSLRAMVREHEATPEVKAVRP